MHGRVCLAVAVLAASGLGIQSTHADDWTTQGGDAGMTHYSADNIPTTVTFKYSKRFYSILSNDPSFNYYYSNSILIKNGTAAVFSYDSPPTVSSDNFGQG